MATRTQVIVERTPDVAKERRLQALREEAARSGRVDAPGVRPAGSPFPSTGALPEASGETGYYGLPLIKHPTWIWTVPLYFFVGGAAGAAAVIAAAARWTRGRDARLARDARAIAVAGSVLSPALLVADLGRPGRFLHMLRVIKPQSPMSMGVWILVLFSGAVDGATASRLLAARARRRPLRWLLGAGADAAESAGAALGGALATYTGVLIGVTAVPVWARNVRVLPFHFGASGVASASALLELRHDDPALHRIGFAAACAETVAGAAIEADGSRGQDPLKHGRSGRLTRLGGLLSGPASLLIRLLAGRWRAGRVAAATVSLAGSLITRVAWIEAGEASSEDPREPLGLPEPT